MRWTKATRLPGRHLYRVCTRHWGVPMPSGKAAFSDGKNPALEITSALYIPGNKASFFDVLVSPYLDFSEQFENVSLFQESVSLRGMDVDVGELARKWSELKELETHRSGLEEERKTLAKTIKTLKNNPQNEERIGELKERGKKIRNEFKDVMQRLWDLEEVAIIGALNLPNNLHDSMTGRNDKLLYSVSEKPVFDFHPKGHVDLGAISDELEIIDSSPTAYYLKNRLALLEIVCNDLFLTALRERDFLVMSNSDTVKAVVVEGCGMHVRDRPHHNRLSTGTEHDINALYLVGGGSLQAFAAFFTKHVVDKAEQLPIRAATVGRNYNPRTQPYPGLLGCRQSSVVDGFVLYENVSTQEKTLLHDATVTLIATYLQLGVHFQVVQYSARQLYPHEGAALGFLMFSPRTSQYHEVARISLCGDYISRRLWMLCKKKDKYASFLSALQVRACHTARLLALLMENCQEEDGSYTLPGCLHSAVQSF